VRDNETLELLNIIILSVAVGTFLFAAMGGAAFAGLASALGAGEFAFGLISALPVLASLLQILASYLVEKTGKLKVMFLAGGVVQRVAWFTVAFIPYVFTGTSPRVLALIVLVTLAAMGGSFVGITHMTLMAAVVPGEVRGRYITIRQRISIFVSLFAGLCIAFILDRIPGFLGFTIVFAFGGIAGLIDILMYAKYRFPEKKPNNTAFNLAKNIKIIFTAVRTKNYFIFWIVWGFIVNLSAPFFMKYAMAVLELSFLSIIFFGQVTANMIALFIFSRWGVLIDRYGSVAIMFISAMMSTVGVSVWIFAEPGVVLSLFLFNFIGGLFWCANDACMVNMQLSHVPEIGRPVTLAIYAVATSVATAAAFITGGAVLEVLSPIMANLNLTVFGTPFDHYKVLFAFTFFLRFVVVIIFLPRVWNEKGLTLRETYALMFTNFKKKIRRRV